MTLDRKTPPPARSIRHTDFLKAETTVLSNGIPVHIIPSGKQQVIGFELIFRNGGVRHETKNGVSFFTVKMLAEGTKYKDADAISHAFDDYGAFLQLTPGLDYASAELYTLTRHIKPLLNTLRELIVASVFPEKELQKLKNIQRQNLKVNQQKPNVLANKYIKAALFGTHHPYGKSLDKEAIDNVTREDLLHYYESQLMAGMEIIIAGDVTTEVLQATETFFGSLSLKPSIADHALPRAHTNTEKRTVIERPSQLQSSIRMGFPLFTKDHPDFHKMKVLNTVLGGYFGSRLMRNIREEKGLTYGINSGLIMLVSSGYFIIGTEVKKEYTAKAIEEIYKEIDLLGEEYLSSTELNTVKNYMAGRLLLSVDTPFALAEKFKNIYLHGLTYEFYKKHLTTISTIDAESLRETARKYLISKNLQEVVVGSYE